MRASREHFCSATGDIPTSNYSTLEGDPRDSLKISSRFPRDFLEIAKGSHSYGLLNSNEFECCAGYAGTRETKREVDGRLAVGRRAVERQVGKRVRCARAARTSQHRLRPRYVTHRQQPERCERTANTIPARAATLGTARVAACSRREQYCTCLRIGGTRPPTSTIALG